MDTPKGSDAGFIVKYRQEYYDLSEFMHKHPDMTARFMKAPPHSDAAMYLMKEYKVKSEDPRIPMTKPRHQARRIDNGQDSQERSNESEDKNNNQLDESMELTQD
ncbi:GL11561 [Drosophila persimilis]|uniref:GL11561 n=1 Tax=Drosophila persimilis TaxID=7234 RepID=B4GBP3_DROPE|nr:GL11561 [Drosophila persimilis]